MPAETHLEGTPIGRTEVLDLIRDRLAERILEQISREELDRHAEKLANRETDPYTLVDQLLEQSGFGKTAR